MIRVYIKSYGTPGDVEYKKLKKPGTLAEWVAEAKVSKESRAGFMECTSAPDAGSTTEKQILVNVEQIEWILQE
jgi:hypothetical protein